MASSRPHKHSPLGGLYSIACLVLAGCGGPPAADVADPCCDAPAAVVEVATCFDPSPSVEGKAPGINQRALDALANVVSGDYPGASYPLPGLHLAIRTLPEDHNPLSPESVVLDEVVPPLSSEGPPPLASSPDEDPLAMLQAREEWTDDHAVRAALADAIRRADLGIAGTSRITDCILGASRQIGGSGLVVVISDMEQEAGTQQLVDEDLAGIRLLLVQVAEAPAVAAAVRADLDAVLAPSGAQVTWTTAERVAVEVSGAIASEVRR